MKQRRHSLSRWLCRNSHVPEVVLLAGCKRAMLCYVTCLACLCFSWLGMPRAIPLYAAEVHKVRFFHSERWRSSRPSCQSMPNLFLYCEVGNVTQSVLPTCTVNKISELCHPRLDLFGLPLPQLEDLDGGSKGPRRVTLVPWAAREDQCSRACDLRIARVGALGPFCS